MLAITDLDSNIHLAKQATTTTVPVMMSDKITARLIYGNTMESSHIATVQLRGLSKQARQIHTFQKIKHPH